MRPLDYQIPHHAQGIFRTLAVSSGGGPVIDLCCSYGINAALLGHELTLAELYDHYAGTSAESAVPDSQFFASRKRHNAPAGDRDRHVRIGDQLRAADGLAAQGVRRKPGTRGPEPRAACRGGGHEPDRPHRWRRVHLAGDLPTGSRLSRPPWVAAFVSRGVPYQPIADTLAEFGLVIERLTTRTFPQRRFASAGEASSVRDIRTERGIAVAGKEDTGYHHAELYLSRRASEIDNLPLTALLP
ncbi:hypothetical protein [Crossiella sp. CA198]|uniref:hypothetical protein n=1 Tax=Crossiella sp. CA198 TaxID=3455607 RepID=UPI003F8D8570